MRWRRRTAFCGRKLNGRLLLLLLLRGRRVGVGQDPACAGIVGAGTGEFGNVGVFGWGKIGLGGGGLVVAAAVAVAEKQEA